MDKKAPKKIHTNIPNQQKQKNSEKANKIISQTKVRPITGIKSEQNKRINLKKKSNTPKKISVINLNEEISLKVTKNSKVNNINKKSNQKENNKKMNNVNSNISNNTNKTQTESKNLTIIEQLTNLTSLYNALSLINLKLDSTFSTQKEESERSLNNKYTEAIELKEKNFKLFQQINSMSNIIDIDDYLINNYSKIIEVYPKISNVVENMNDIVSNINYSVDRMYLIDDLLCDQNILEKNIAQIKNDFEIMNKNIEKKIDEINSNKKKYEELYNKLMNNDKEIQNIENKLDIYKQNILTNNIDDIYQKLSEKNKKLLNDILND